MPIKVLEAMDRSRSVAITSTLILAENAVRVWAAVVNQGANDVWLRLGEPAVLNTGIYLKAGGGAVILDMITTPWYGEVRAIAITAPSIVTCQEVQEKQ